MWWDLFIAITHLMFVCFLFFSVAFYNTVPHVWCRYIMYYILTADRLERMATWQQKLPSPKTGGGPIEHLKGVIIDDSLGICDELDRRMEGLVQTYHDDWEDSKCSTV